MTPRPHATTIVGVRRGGTVAIAGDGQVTVGDVVMKHRAAKVRRLHRDTVLAGFAGAVADALTLFDKFEQQLDRHQGHLLRAAVGLAKEWRTDRYLRHLEAMLIVANRDQLLLLSGDGEIIEPDDDLAAIGSGGPYALAAAKALLQNTDLDAAEVARRALIIAASLCIYTNDEITVETLPIDTPGSEVAAETMAVPAQPPGETVETVATPVPPPGGTAETMAAPISPPGETADGGEPR